MTESKLEESPVWAINEKEETKMSTPFDLVISNGRVMDPETMYD